MTTDTERRTLVEAQPRRLVAGATFPDYELTGHDRRRYRLNDVQGTDPMIVILSRGHYCPKDFEQHRLLVDFYPQIAVSYTKIVTISTDTIYEANGTRWSSSPVCASIAFTTATGSGGGRRPMSCGVTCGRSVAASGRTGI